ncbi:hypothetical protein AMTRI_Chr08g209300 [Amborella trichopoda]|uniref:Uncharacterized protein n=1 Tax=Amborella trichopoda TaxID=13333 RepID=W1PBU2_AMBTC|nr:uncharacterized protein LOC18433592 [Amborella trichopoda]ERN05413.1 hypothetical protein AMTR_s00007p00226200 [Amborella trichopoda]|eukprot:XP_006843738.1 uncharacterized protein LOC18433592 [Amborella trichopoda]
MQTLKEEVDQRKLEIRENDKFYNRLLSRDTSIRNSSFRVYYGGATGSIPFNWESQPGTPKHSFTSDKLPPLTPPPSYHFLSHHPPPTKTSQTKRMMGILPKIALRKREASQASRLSASGSMSSMSSMSWGGDDAHEFSFCSSPTSPLHFSSHGEFASLRGCGSVAAMKHVWSSILGRRIA